MVANIPFSLHENLAPREVGELLNAAQESKCEPEEIIVFALRDYLAQRRDSGNQLPEAQAVMAATAA